MSRLFAIIHKELLALSRDVHGLAVLFVMPAVFILIMSLALKGVFSDESSERLRFSVVDSELSAISQGFVRRLGESQFHFASEFSGLNLSELKSKLRQGKLHFVVVVHDGFEQSQTDFDNERQEPLLTLLVDPAINAPFEAAFKGMLLESVTKQKMELMLLATGMSMKSAHQTVATRADKMAGNSLVNVEYLMDSSKQRPTSVQQSVPAWLVFSMFFVVIPISTIFIKEREMGTLARLVTMRVPMSYILLGKFVPYFLINQLQAVAMILVGVYLVPLLGGDALELGSNYLGLWLVTAATSVAAVGLALLLAVIAKTTEHAATLGGVSNIILGALGGVMVPRFVMPDMMQSLSELSPMAWALDGFLTILLRTGSLADIAPELGALLLFGFLMTVLATIVFKQAGLR